MLALDAVEAGWVAADTFRSWARYVEELRGVPVVPHRERIYA